MRSESETVFVAAVSGLAAAMMMGNKSPDEKAIESVLVAEAVYARLQERGYNLERLGDES